jgi:hypothetical protein
MKCASEGGDLFEKASGFAMFLYNEPQNVSLKAGEMGQGSRNEMHFP